MGKRESSSIGTDNGADIYLYMFKTLHTFFMYHMISGMRGMQIF